MLRLGTRGSPLAVIQSQWVARQIEEASNVAVSLEIIRTSGDIQQDRPLYEIGGKGLFTKELDLALLDGAIDLAVHSLKDLPTDLPNGVSIGAVPVREDPRDVLIGPKAIDLSLLTLRQGARVGTSSLRRQALLRALRPDLAVRDLRGNLDTRIRKVDEGEIDAIVVASAGVRRLGMTDRASQYLETGGWLPAPGQGALGVVVRTEDIGRAPWLRALDHPPTRAATLAERTVLSLLDAGCQMPVAALGIPFAGGLRLQGSVAAPNGSRVVRAEGTGALDDPGSLGAAVGRELLERGADLILDGLRRSTHTGD